MKKVILFIIILALSHVVLAQTTIEKKFEATVNTIIRAFSKQDNALLSQYIDASKGVYIAFRSGAFDNFLLTHTITFSDNNFPYVLMNDSKGITLSKIKYTTLPEWNCDSEAWSKTGVFIDTTQTDHLLSKICVARNKYVPDTISQQQINFFISLENKSRRIVIQDTNKNSLVFYVTYINGDWKLTIIDFASSDCSV